jgi:ATP-dependent Clp protease ATP-binding subunit ClpA
MNIKFNQNRVSLETIIKIIESKCNSNIYDLESKSLYDYLKKELKKKIIGQEECINTIVDKLNLLKNKKNNLPISFLLEGYDGTGKTTLVTELSNLLNRNLIKLNMNEFNSEISINKIIGSPQGYIGYNDNNTIFESLKLNPNSIILIDEIDKAHISVLDLISKILEDGFIRNSKNETISFKNSIIFFTTNLISKSTIGYVNSNTSENNNIPKYITDKINYKIKLNKLNKENLKDIMEIQLKKLNNDYNSNIIISDTQMNALIKSLNSTNGAKNIDKILKDYIEKKLIASNTL